ncbi:MAG: hypothetical protein HYT89_06530 [Candidatus Omnitrophica bacterium]|nr:hypothetical protein [Candidatus Omnitrophota bacterium]
MKKNIKRTESRPIASIVTSLGALSSRWLKKDCPFRKKAVRRLVDRSGYAGKMASAMLDALFGELTAPKLWRLLRAELGDPRVLDEFRRDRITGKWRRARGPAVITHIFSSNVPSPAITSFVLGMLVKSVNLGKVSRRDHGFLDIYLESLSKHDPRLAATSRLLPLGVKGGGYAFLRGPLHRSGLVVAYGSDETLSEIKKNIPQGTAFEGYGHRVSVGVYVGPAARTSAVAKKAARDVWMSGQRGCLSPLVLFIEGRKESEVLPFARAFKRALERDAKGKWLVSYDDDLSHVSLPKSDRVVPIKVFRKIEDVFKALRPFARWLQGVSLEAPEPQRRRWAERLSAMGVNRICRAGRMQVPPITWHHDGRPNLAHWLKWADWEE